MLCRLRKIGNKMNIELNDQESQILIELLDTACKSSGLAVAGNCLHFVKKIQDAAEQEKDNDKKAKV